MLDDSESAAVSVHNRRGREERGSHFLFHDSTLRLRERCGPLITSQIHPWEVFDLLEIQSRRIGPRHLAISLPAQTPGRPTTHTAHFDPILQRQPSSALF